MPVQILKLSNGETILCDVIDASDRIVTIINPLEIKTERGASESRMNMIAYQWLPMMEDENIMYIHQAHIVGMAHANSDMQEYYVEAIERILFPERAWERELKEREELYEKIKQVAKQANTKNETVH
jgi:predicted ATPase